MKLLYFDTETTGTIPEVHDIIQLSYIIEVDNEIMEESDYHIRPFSPNVFESKAVEVHGITPEIWNTYTDPHIVYHSIILQWNRYVDKYNPEDKFIPVAYNGSFDSSFLNSFFQKLNDKYLGSFIDQKALIDPLSILRVLKALKKADFENNRLSTIASELSITLTAHDALSDCKALREITHTLFDYLGPLPPLTPEVSKQQKAELDFVLDNLSKKYAGK